MSDHFLDLASQYRSALFDDVLPFWQRHSVDAEHGGYFTCLDRKGGVYDSDKFVWLQARQVWTFSMLYHEVEQREDWLGVARSGADFLRRHGRDDAGNWYFSLTRDGRPLVQPYNIFSDCFAAMAFAKFGLVTGDEESLQIGRLAYDNVWRRAENPKGIYDKIVPGTRPMKSFALPMILANLSLELEALLAPELLERSLETCVHDVMDVFLDAETGLVFEHLAPDGSHPDSFEGRLINPGHGIEAMWFIMSIAERRGDRALIERCVQTVLRLLDFGWDQEHGGIFYFLDAQGKPPQQLEWDRKLWWVHLEALIALAKGYRLSGDSRLWDWYQRVHDYSWSRFPDPEHGEWFGYLDRAGTPFLPLKGGKWKGCFHLPRALKICGDEFARLAEAPQ